MLHRDRQIAGTAAEEWEPALRSGLEEPVELVGGEHPLVEQGARIDGLKAGLRKILQRALEIVLRAGDVE